MDKIEAQEKLRDNLPETLVGKIAFYVVEKKKSRDQRPTGSLQSNGSRST